jgi:hypothetical protein
LPPSHSGRIQLPAEGCFGTPPLHAPATGIPCNRMHRGRRTTFQHRLSNVASPKIGGCDHNPKTVRVCVELRGPDHHGCRVAAASVGCFASAVKAVMSAAKKLLPSPVSPCQGNDNLLHAAVPGDLHRPGLEPGPSCRTEQHALGRFVKHCPHQLVSPPRYCSRYGQSRPIGTWRTSIQTPPD